MPRLVLLQGPLQGVSDSLGLGRFLIPTRTTEDNIVFKIFYKFSLGVLFICAFICAVQYMGHSIKCVDQKDFDITFINSYCFIHGKYTIPDALKKNKYMVAHPGVAPLVRKTQTVKYHHYYIWVSIALWVQGVLFYIPYFLWKLYENGFMEQMVANSGNVKVLTEFVSAHMKYSNNYWYFGVYSLCEILNFVNVIFQMLFMDWLLGYEFFTYGIQVLMSSELDPEDRLDVFEQIFPKMVKCTFKKYGVGGNIVNYDNLCVLPMNIINEKVYLFLWFWYFILLFIAGAQIIFRIVTFLLSRVRVWLIERNCINHTDRPFIMSRDVRRLIMECSRGNWFILYQFRNYVSRDTFTDILNKLADQYCRDRQTNDEIV